MDTVWNTSVIDAINGIDTETIPSEFDNTYDKLNKDLARPYFNTPLYDNRKPPVKIQPTEANFDQLISNTTRDTEMVTKIFNDELKMSNKPNVVINNLYGMDLKSVPTSNDSMYMTFANDNRRTQIKSDFTKFNNTDSMYYQTEGFKSEGFKSEGFNMEKMSGMSSHPSTRSGAELCLPGGVGVNCGKRASDNAKETEKIKQNAETQRAAIVASANAQIAVAKSNEEIARAKFARDEALADNHRQEAEAMYQAQVAVAQSQEEISRAKFVRDAAIADSERQAQESANQTAQKISGDKAAVAIAQEATTQEVARQSAAVAAETIRRAAEVDQAKISESGQTDRTKLLLAAQVDLTNINAVETTKRQAIEASARNYAVQQQTAALVALADANAKTADTAIVSANQTTQDIVAANANTQAKISRDNMMTVDAVGKNVGNAVANSLGVSLGPNGVQGILGEVEDIVNNKDAQFNRLLTEQARQETIRQQMQIAKDMNTTTLLLQSQQQERLLALQRAQDESDRAIKMIKQLQGPSGNMLSGTSLEQKSDLTTSQTLSKLVSNIVVEAITKCQSSLEMDQEIGGSSGKITISGSKNINFKPKQILSFSANCMQDSSSISSMNDKISEQIKDFMSIQSKTVLDSMEKTPQQINSTIDNEVNNTFKQSAITEIITNFKLAQRIGNIDITNSENVDFSPEQTTSLLMAATQKTTNQLSVIKDLSVTADKTQNVQQEYTATSSQTTYQILGALFFIVLLIIFVYLAKSNAVTRQPGVYTSPPSQQPPTKPQV